MAFPNAYVSTDEPPRRPVFRSILCWAAVVGFAYLGLVILVLSVFWGQYSPITQVASDYGVGAYAAEMNSGFFFAGAGMLGLSSAVLSSARTRSVRGGALLLIPAALALLLNAFFQTDLEGTAQTLHGTIHGADGGVFFVTAPAGLLMISRKFGGRWTKLLAGGVALAIASLIIPPALGLDAGGLGERVLIFVVFSAAILTGLRTMKEA